MARFKDWTVTMTITEESVERPEPVYGSDFYSSPEIKLAIRKALESQLKGCRVEQTALIEGKEYYA